MKTIYLQKTGLAFFCCDEVGEDWMITAEDGRYKVQKVSERSYQQHKLFFSMLQTTFENQEQFTTLEALREALLMEAEHVEMREKLNGECYLVARSIAFKATEQEEFNSLVDRVRAVIVTHWDFDPLGENNV